jgi:hypothetical protein
MIKNNLKKTKNKYNKKFLVKINNKLFLLKKIFKMRINKFKKIPMKFYNKLN